MKPPISLVSDVATIVKKSNMKQYDVAEVAIAFANSFKTNVEARRVFAMFDYYLSADIARLHGRSKPAMNERLNNTTLPKGWMIEYANRLFYYYKTN